MKEVVKPNKDNFWRYLDEEARGCVKRDYKWNRWGNNKNNK